MKILGHILKRIIQTIPLLFFISIISFFIIRLSPVDPLGELRLNPSISQETLEKEQKRLGLDTRRVSLVAQMVKHPLTMQETRF